MEDRKRSDPAKPGDAQEQYDASRKFHKGKHKWNSLVWRLLFVVCASFLPLNLLAIIVSGVVIWQASARVQEADQRELETVMEELGSDLARIDNGVEEFVLSYMTELTLADGSDDMISYQMSHSLKEILENGGRLGAVCLYDKMTDRLFFRYMGGTYSVSEVDQMKQTLLDGRRRMVRETEDAAGSGGARETEQTPDGQNAADGADSRAERPVQDAAAMEWQFMRIGTLFLRKTYEYTNYQILFLIDMEAFAEQAGDSALWRENEVYLTDGQSVYRMIPETEADRETGTAGGNAAEALYAAAGEEEETGAALLIGVQDRDWEELFVGRFLTQSVQYRLPQIGLSAGIPAVNAGAGGGIPAFYWLLLLAAVSSFLLLFGIWRLLRQCVIRPLRLLQEAMRELEQERLDYRIGEPDREETIEFRYLYAAFNHMAEEIELSRAKDKKMYEAELANLRLQVNPHMLLNSFNMIYSLAQSRNYACIQEYSLLLVDYFRYALRESDRFVTLEKEMQFVESYIAIQKIRFPGAFTSVYQIDEGCGQALVLPLLIQNFVENAMKYALMPDKTIEVLINIRREGERLLISVCDTGRGMKPEILSCLQEGRRYEDRMGRQHIGVWNCRRRMTLFYGEEASLKILSVQGEGTQVWLDLPYREEKNAADDCG
ncbi:MAG: histidine kinase [Eubacteriales bacterium]|nr:histidine kinase [Eubacteriales bacterium]